MPVNGLNAGPGGEQQAPAPKGSAAGAEPLDALTGFFNAAAAAAKKAEQGQPDPRVWIAFALGWQLAELYRPDRHRTANPVAEDDLPGLGRFTVDEWTHLGLDQVQAGITKLCNSIAVAGLDIPDAEAFAATIASSADPNERSRQMRAFHVDLLSTLTAADFRMGKAYGLGRALADTTRDPEKLRAELAAHRVGTLTEWIRQLATAFPPHGAQAVAGSLQAWSAWVLSSTAVQAQDTDALKKLRGQGRAWRTLLSGEKRATDTLQSDDYLKAGEGLVQRSRALAGHFLRHYWWLAGIIAVLFVGGLVVILAVGDPAGIATGVAGILASLGLTWKGVGATLGATAAHLEEPLWGAELDLAICGRITHLPTVPGEPAASLKQ